ncbi:MAG: outer membrane beta-barrel protein [Thermoguttaceae bacterium]|nr:outer membrane beta-barrel protein [Thermoguttaceae bacterium]
MKRILFLAALLGATTLSGASFGYDVFHTIPGTEGPAPVQSAAPVYDDYYEVGAFAEADEVDRFISGSVVGGWCDGFLQDGSRWNMYQAWLSSEKTVDPNMGFDLGYRVDALFGTNILQSSDGFDGKWGVSDDGYGASIYQAYGQLGLGKLSLKAGKLGTTIGFESVDASQNNFNTHSYMFNHEPTTHTGGLFTFQATDTFNIDVGLVSGVDNSFANRRGDSGFLFGAGWQIAENVNLSYAGVLSQIHSELGENRAATAWGYYGDLFGPSIGDSDEYLQTVTATVDFTDRFSYSLASNYGAMSARDVHDNLYSQFGVANYFSYALTPCLTLAARYEYYTQWLDDAAIGPDGEMKQVCHDVSFAMVYRPFEHFFILPEARYDWIETGNIKDKISNKEDGFTGSVSCGFTF